MLFCTLLCVFFKIVGAYFKSTIFIIRTTQNMVVLGHNYFLQNALIYRFVSGYALPQYMLPNLNYEVKNRVGILEISNKNRKNLIRTIQVPILLYKIL